MDRKLLIWLAKNNGAIRYDPGKITVYVDEYYFEHHWTEEEEKLSADIIIRVTEQCIQTAKRNMKRK